MPVIGLPEGSLVQLMSVVIPGWLLATSLILGRAEPQTVRWSGPLKPRDWVCLGSCPLNVPTLGCSPFPQGSSLWGNPVPGCVGLSRLLSGVLLVTCRSGVNTSPFSQSFPGCTHGEARICFLVMLLKCPALAPVSWTETQPKQKPTWEALLQHLSSV